MFVVLYLALVLEHQVFNLKHALVLDQVDVRDLRHCLAHCLLLCIHIVLFYLLLHIMVLQFRQHLLKATVSHVLFLNPLFYQTKFRH